MDVLQSENVTRRTLALWMLEALALQSLGMPPRAFTLILDGSPIPDAATEVFKIVQRDPAWQMAFEATCTSRGIIPGSFRWLEMRSNECYIMKGFPKALHQIAEGISPLVKCNFSAGEPWDVEDLAGISRLWAFEDWREAWHGHKPNFFETKRPLPEWIDIRFEEVLPDESGMD